jgi:hypothetical protein
MAQLGRALAGTCAIALLAAGCGGSGTPPGAKPTGTASITQQCLQYAGPGTGGTTCRSPDGAWKVTYRRAGLYLNRRGTGTSLRMYHSNDSCCDMITWVRPHTLLFVDDYRVFRLDPATRRRSKIAGFSNFVVSPNQRWLAGWADAGPNETSTVDIESTKGTNCLAVPHTPHQTDTAAGFTPDGKNVIVRRMQFSTSGGPYGLARLVQYAIGSLHGHC